MGTRLPSCSQPLTPSRVLGRSVTGIVSMVTAWIVGKMSMNVTIGGVVSGGVGGRVSTRLL